MVRGSKLLLALVIGTGLLLLWAGGAMAAFEYAGVSARPMAMGGAFVGLADDVNALYYNPAGLAFIKEREETFMHAGKLGVLSRDYIALAVPTAGFYVFRDQAVLESEEGEASMSESIYSASYGIKLLPLVSLGASGKIMVMKSPLGSDVGLGIDVGALLKPVEMISVGVLVRNIGGGNLGKIGGEALDVNPEVAVGAAVKDLGKIVTAAADVVLMKNPADAASWTVGINAGAEAKLMKLLALRAGYNNGRITAGLGLFQERWGIDYAIGLEKGGLDGFSHHISLALRF
jgi:hypothetical protein